MSSNIHNSNVQSESALGGPLLSPHLSAQDASSVHSQSRIQVLILTSSSTSNPPSPRPNQHGDELNEDFIRCPSTEVVISSMTTKHRQQSSSLLETKADFDQREDESEGSPSRKTKADPAANTGAATLANKQHTFTPTSVQHPTSVTTTPDLSSPEAATPTPALTARTSWIRECPVQQRRQQETHFADRTDTTRQTQSSMIPEQLSPPCLPSLDHDEFSQEASAQQLPRMNLIRRSMAFSQDSMDLQFQNYHHAAPSFDNYNYGGNTFAPIQRAHGFHSYRRPQAPEDVSGAGLSSPTSIAMDEEHFVEASHPSTPSTTCIYWEERVADPMEIWYPMFEDGQQYD